MSVMKTPVNGPERAITLFRDVDFCYASGLSFRVVYLIPVKHQNDVGIRLDFPGVFQVRVHWAFIGSGFHAAGELAQSNQRKTAGFCQAFKSL